MSDLAQIIRDFSQLTGNQFLEKYPQVDREAYWDVGGEGLIQALAGYRKQPELLTPEEIGKAIDRASEEQYFKGSKGISTCESVAQAQLDKKPDEAQKIDWAKQWKKSDKKAL